MADIDIRHLSKAYGTTQALDRVDLSLKAGRVHSLMGENGAGKSTLIKILAGVVPADEMTTTVNGTQVEIASAKDAAQAGFRFIHQELNIVPQVSVAENILLGRKFPTRFGGAVNWCQTRAQAREALDMLGVDHIDVRSLAGDLSVGDQMLTKIAAALVRDGNTHEHGVLYVLDEPTAALTSAESELLFDVIARLAKTGAAVLYVSHRLDEVLRICDAVTVLRDGRLVSTAPIAKTSKAQIIRDMTGRDVANAYPDPAKPAAPGVIAEMDGVSAGPLAEISFELCAGEVLGIAGLANSGQSAVLETFLGRHPVTRGKALFKGAPLPRDPQNAWRNGVAYLPKERRSEGLMPKQSIRENVALPHLNGLRSSLQKERAATENLSRQMRLKCDHLEQPVEQLSGGNQQKVLFARALHGTPSLLLLDEPTRGVDVGAKYDIYRIVRDATAQGCAVLMASSDLPELLGMCDRILVLQDGRQSALLDCDGLSTSDLLSHFYAPEAA